MSKIDSGEPAFPVTFYHNHPDGSSHLQEWPGMTKREWYAGLAMQGFNANPRWNEETYAKVAGMAFSQADEMIAAASKIASE